MTAPVFLSASEPNPQRSAEYWDSRKLLNVREAVRAFCAHALAHFPVVFGGHPAITPLVNNVAERITFDAKLGARQEDATPQPRVVRFQSGLFVDRASSADEVITDPHDENGVIKSRRNGMRNESLLRMRYEMIAKPISMTMPKSLQDDRDHWLLRNHGKTFGDARKERLGTYEFAAAVFIGGMEGVIHEFNIFRSFHPDTPAFPIAGTGAACAKLLGETAENLRPDLSKDLREETAYSLLMQKILPPQMAATKDLAAAKAAVWREGPPPPFTLADHSDPKGINQRYRDGKRDGENGGKAL
jgi:hypothetical protein